MSPLIAHRGRLVVLGVLLVAASLVAMLTLDVPSAGIAYFDVLPIALIGLATGPFWGASAGLGTGLLYPLVALLDSELPTAEGLRTTAGVRLVAYVAVGALIGWFAREQRRAAVRLEALATRDPLTGLLNVRAYEEALARRIAAGEQFTLLLADMDGLKQLNDRDGHSAGNEALQRLARSLAAAVRAEDDVARIGGDEFSIVAGGTGARAAAALTARLVSDLEQAGVPASFGWAIFPDDASDAASLFRCADARLYDGKRLRARPPARQAV